MLTAKYTIIPAISQILSEKISALRALKIPTSETTALGIKNKGEKFCNISIGEYAISVTR